MINAIDILFNEWIDSEIKSSPEYERLLENKNINEYYTISSAVVEEQKLAFKAGFRIAVQLIVGSTEQT